MKFRLTGLSHFLLGIGLGVYFVLTLAITASNQRMIGELSFMVFHLGAFLLMIFLYVSAHYILGKMGYTVNTYPRIISVFIIGGIVSTMVMDTLFKSVDLPFYNQLLLGFWFVGVLYVFGGIDDENEGHFFFLIEEEEESIHTKNA